MSRTISLSQGQSQTVRLHISSSYRELAAAAYGMWCPQATVALLALPLLFHLGVYARLMHLETPFVSSTTYCSGAATSKMAHRTRPLHDSLA